jgi:hypothetical protein
MALAGINGFAQELELPPRPTDAPKGSAVAASLASLAREEREQRVVAEVARGNVPDFLRRLAPVSVTRATPDGSNTVTFFVAPDYLAVGADADYFLAALSPGAAQRVAELTGCLLPTRVMVDAIYAAAAVKLSPTPLPAGPEMTTVPVFLKHNDLIWGQRRAAGEAHPLGALVAGHKKDVVVTPRLATAPGKVAIYGWHRTNGAPIQPLYLGHSASWVDYSHGIRLVHRTARLNGRQKPLAEILADPEVAGLLSDEGPLARPRYPTSDEAAPGPPSGRMEEEAPRAYERSHGTGEAPRSDERRHEERSWQSSRHFAEQTMTITLKPDVRVHVNAPSPEVLAARRSLQLVLYALPNGNTIEQTVGKRLQAGEDWHFDIQHIGAQTRWLRAADTNRALVVACLEAAGRSWPAWRRKHGSERIPAIVAGVRRLFPVHEVGLVLHGHSGGGSFIFGYLDSLERIREEVERIAFLDSNYAYDPAAGHAGKLIAWLRSPTPRYLCVLAYDDASARLEGKPFVSAAGGTWGRSHALLADLAQAFEFTSQTNAGLRRHTALGGRVQFLLKENPERKVLHTVQVERNGFIHSLLAGTPRESKGYEYLGVRVYTKWIQPE